jgi:hypothetical protein
LSRLPVEQLPARLNALDLSGTEVHHLPDWKGYEDPKRLEIIRHIAMMRGRDPRIASLAVDIIKKAKVKPRDYKGQAAALLAWVQNPKNVFYINEPGERLQDPIFTIKQGWGDCDDQILVLTSLFESIRLPWKLVLGGTCKGKKTRFIEGETFPRGCKWAHIYAMVGDAPFGPKRWYFCETTVQGVPLGWDVISGHKSYLPELEPRPKGKAKVMKLRRKAPKRFRPTKAPPPSRRSPAYRVALGGFQPGAHSDYGQAALSPIGAAVGASMAVEMEDDGDGWWEEGSASEKAKAALIDVKKVLPAVVTGVLVSVTTQLLLDWLRPKLGIQKKKQPTHAELMAAMAARR